MKEKNMRMKKIFVLAILSALSSPASAIARLESDTCVVEISGIFILCPDDTSVLNATPTFTTYQWYRRPYGHNEAPTPIPGATSSTLVVNAYDDVGFEFIVVASSNACTDTSEPVLVDGYVFLPPIVAQYGEFESGPNGEMRICPGDTLLWELLPPYTQNIQWSKDGMDIPGANTHLYAATEPGTYSVRGAPEVCPEYIEELGVDLVVEWKANCQSFTTGPTAKAENIRVYVQPAQCRLIVDIADPTPAYVRVFDPLGRLMVADIVSSSNSWDVCDWNTGLIWVQVEQKGLFWAQTLILVR